MREAFLRIFVLIAKRLRFLMPFSIQVSKNYLETKYREALALRGSQRKDELYRLAMLRQKLHPPMETFFVTIQPEPGIFLKANLCQQYCGDIFYGVGFEPSELGLVRDFLSDGDVFFDVGANIGVYTLLASRLVGSGGQVHSFEPMTDAFDLLKENVNNDRCLNVTLNQAAVGDEDGEASLYVNAQNALSSLGNTQRGQFLKPKKVRLLKLDSYAESSGILVIDFLKIDVEGFEGHVLRGTEVLLSSSPNPVVLSELAQKNFEPLGFSVSEVLSWMRKHGFEVYMVENQTPKLHLLTDNLEKYPYQNFLFIRPDHPKHSLLEPYLKL